MKYRVINRDHEEARSSMKKHSVLNEVFAQAREIAELHAVLSSPRGDSFRANLLQEAHTRRESSDLEALRRQSKLSEYQRHVHKLAQFDLIDVERDHGGTHYHRTTRGEAAVNILRELNRRLGRLGEEVAAKIHDAVLGVNSIRLFLKLYSCERQASFPDGEVTFDPHEIGEICHFLPRTIEGYAAVDKVADAGFLTYRDDNRFVFAPAKARAFYQYLVSLLELAK